MPEKSKPRKRRPSAKPRPRVSYQGNPAYRGARRRGKARINLSALFARITTRRQLFIYGLRFFMACCIILGLSVIYFARNLPDIHALETIKKQQGITIETEDGHVIANYGDVYGSYLTYDELPKSLVQAVIATEDRRFFEHHGVDFWGIARAMMINVAHGHLVQGGSTITQQVAKNVFLTPERSLSRKMQEMILAFWLEGHFTKKEIMAIYLNRVYLGAGTFGVDAAAHRYFNKSAHDLNLYESALMAGLLKAPSRYSPAANVDRARERVHQVLLNMVDAGYLKQKDVAPTMTNYTKSAAHQVEGGDVRYFTDWVVDEIPNYVGQVDEDMIVTTTLNPTLQSQGQDALQNTISMQGGDKNVSQGALVAMDPDGAVRAMVGGLSYAQSQYNRAAQAKRQPGSVFKIFVYLAALEAGMTPQSTVEDAPISLQVGNKIWTPDNFSNGKYLGEIPMVEALRNSLNTVSVRLSQYAGIDHVAQMAMRLGVPNIPAHPSIALGAVEATLLEMTGAYAHLANGGNQVQPYGILSIRLRSGDELYKREPKDAPQVLASGTVQMMNYMLLDVVQRGTGTKAALGGRPAAGKTGTSSDYKDAWFIGFTPQLVAGVWIGNDDNRPMKKVTGGSIPALIWHDFMTHAMDGKPVRGIPNSPSSSDGLFPWLFGGSNDRPVDTSIPTTIPEDAPFARQIPTADSPLPEQPPAPVIQADRPVVAPTAPTPAPAQQQDTLTPEFWDKLMKKAPTIDRRKVEYTYPSDTRH